MLVSLLINSKFSEQHFKMSAALPPKKRKENRRSEEVCFLLFVNGWPKVYNKQSQSFPKIGWLMYFWHWLHYLTINVSQSQNRIIGKELETIFQVLHLVCLCALYYKLVFGQKCFFFLFEVTIKPFFSAGGGHSLWDWRYVCTDNTF